MVYEYESKLKNRLLDLEFDTWEETAQFEREYRELEEVYRKARAFDEIMKGELGAYYDKAKTFDEILNIDLYKHEEEYAADVLDIVDEYKERADDER